MKKLIAVLTMLSLIVCLLAACSGEQQETKDYEFADTNKDGKVMIGFSAYSLADAWMVTTDEVLRGLCEGYGYGYNSQGAESNSANQMNQIENMVTMGCDWIYATVFEPDILEETLKKAEANNCHIVYIGTPYEDRDAFYAVFSGSQYDYGKAAAEMANEWVNKTYPDAPDGSIEIALFQNTVTEDSLERSNGMLYLEELNKKVKLVETYDLLGQDAANAKCQEYADQLFMKHPDCKLILSYSSDYALAIDEVIMRTATLDPSSIAIFSDDWLEAAGNAVRASASNESTLRGFVGSEDASVTFLKVCRGEVMPDEAGCVSAGFYSFTADNIEDAFEMYKG